MLDELRRDIERRLHDLLSEADKLRHALGALGSDGHAASSQPRGESSAPRSRRATSATRTPARSRRAGSASVTPAGSQPAPTRRARSGETKDAVLGALASGQAMTASDVANATGLNRRSVSTTLSKLAKTGEVTKAARGYQLPDQGATTAPKAT